MCLGALVHAGVPLEYLVEKLSLLKITDEYQLWAELVHRNGQQATKVHVDLTARPEQEPPTFAVSPPDPSKLLPTSSHSHHSEQSLHTHGHLHEQEHPNHAPVQDQDNHDLHADHSHDRHSHDHGNRHLPEIERLITSANLPDRAKQWSLAVFRRLAEAEGAVHGISADQVHFHEVGATDAIVDIVGTCLGLDWLEIDELYCSPIPVGGGTIRAAHGLLPVPAPAVLKLLEMRQVPIYSNGIQRELVTPTGAAIVTTLSTQFGPPPPMTLHRVGLGAGSRNLEIPNIVRLWLGEGDQQAEGSRHKGEGTRGERDKVENKLLHPSSVPSLRERSANSPPPSEGKPQSSLETIVLLETQIDDLNPQAIGYLYEVLLAAGALDVFTQAIGMKKSRPGILLTVVCQSAQVDVCEAIIFRETTTLGIRRSQQVRSVLHREIQTVQTRYGSVRVKVARREAAGAIINAQPEYEDCATVARQAQVPWQEIHRLALHAWYSHTEQDSVLT